MQFEKSFDTTTYLPYFAPTMSSRRTPSSRTRGKTFKKSDFACHDVFTTHSPSSLSKATAKRLQQQDSSVGTTGSHGRSSRIGRRDQRSISAPRLIPEPGSPVAASISSQSILRLSGALDKHHVPLEAGLQLQKFHEEVLSWSMDQMRHQCGRGLMMHIASLLQVCLNTMT